MSALTSLGDTEVADTFAEAFPMRFARLVITAATDGLGARGGPLDDRLCHLGDRLQVRGGDRARARRSDETPDGRPGIARAAVRDGPRGRRQARARARRPVRDDLPHDRVLRRAARRRADGGAGREPALLRRRLPGQQGDRRPALLADPGDGGRVPGLRVGRRRPGSRRREPGDRRRRRRRRARRGAGGGRGDARRGHRAAVPGRDRAQRQQGRRAAPRSRCPPPPTIRWRPRCAPRSPTRWSPTASARCSRS